MTFNILFVLIIIFLMIISLILEITKPDIIVSITLGIFIVVGILTPEEALKGYSNEGLMTIALLFIIAGVVKETNLINKIIHKILDKKSSPKKKLLNLMVPVAMLSSLVNNTPIIVMLIPAIKNWSKEKKISPSKFLLPLSYVTIFGGMITLIGTSTNLVIHGMLKNKGFEGYSFFELAIIGIPAALLGMAYLYFIGYKLLPNYKNSNEEINKYSREFLSEAVVNKEFKYLNKTIKEANLRNLKGIYLFAILRHGEEITPVSSEEKIKVNDRLIFTGIPSSIVELEEMDGLKVETGSTLELEDLKKGNAKLIEVIVSHNSLLLKKEIKKTNFRSKYDATIVAVNRNNERIKDKIGNIRCKAGDVLLLLVGRDFSKKTTENDDFYIASAIKIEKKLEKKQIPIVISVFLLMIMMVSFGVLTMFKGAILALIILYITKCINLQKIRDYIHFNVLVLIGSSFGIGVAMEKTGAADFIANNLLEFTKGFGIVATIFVLYFVTNLFTEIMTNTATAVIMFPIALETAIKLQVEPMGFIIAITIAASAGFSTPIGYQTNLIVYGPGGYKYKDYLKVGMPLNIMYMIITLLIVMFLYY